MNLNCDPAFLQTARQILLKDLTVLFCSYNLEALSAHLAEDIQWHLVGDAPIQGKASFLEALASMQGNPATALEILGIIESGQHGAIHGTMTMSDGQKFGFADCYEFSDGKVQLLTSYVVLWQPDR